MNEEARSERSQAHIEGSMPVVAMPGHESKFLDNNPGLFLLKRG